LLNPYRRTQPIDLTWDPKDLPFRQTPDDSTREYAEREWAATLIHGRGVHNPFYHPQTYGIPVASVHFRSHHIRLLEFFTHFASHAASSLGIPISRVARLPTQRTLWTVPRSPFAHKKAQENFDRRVHKRAIKAWDADPEVVDRWLMYLRKHALGGVGMRVTRWERLPVGYGATRLAHIKQQMAGPAPQTVEEAVKALGEEIIVKELAALESESRVIPART
jgi:small subunit ribosomal protein S10